MTDLFKKLNYKSQKPILVLGAPRSFSPELENMGGETEVHAAPIPGTRYAFAIVFAPMRAELLEGARLALPLVAEDAVLWFAFPKQTSKTFKSDLNRDILWQALGPLGLQPNRNIAIDDDWSALRFKRVQA